MNPLDQERTFCFFLITYTSINNYFFEWYEPNHRLQMKLLNTVCGWHFVRDWNDNEYRYPTGKTVRMCKQIKEECSSLRNEFLKGNNNEHKKLISSLCKTLSSLEDNELFFIFRVIYTFPSQRLLFKVLNELSYIKNGKTKEDADVWYNKYAAKLFDKYKVRFFHHAKVGVLEKNKRTCRFCGKSMPEVRFDKVAHAVPESIGGHRNLICYDECDNCNASFGEGIERNLCEWFEFRRVKYQVRKKSGGVPKAYGRNYVIENNNTNIFVDNIVNNRIKLIGAGTVTLQGIYRALCKIAIDLIDKEHLGQLKTTIEWIQYGRPKSSHYPQIAQMDSLYEVKEPVIYIFTRKDKCDTDDGPLHFCILHIFDMAILYIIPHVNGRMIFQENYTKCIPTEALKIFGFNGKWKWDSYDTTEERNPHVWIDLSEIKLVASDENRQNPIEKLRIERKPKDSIDFIEPKVNITDIYDYKLEYIHFVPIINNQNVSGNVSVKAIIDLSQQLPLFVLLNVTYKEYNRSINLATIIYSAKVSSVVLNHQMNVYDDNSLSINQDLFVHIIDIVLENLYKDIYVKHQDFSYTREMLNANNVRELLNDMQLIFVKDGQIFTSTEGRKLWHTGY